jgi:hypothetical protein
MPRNIDTRPDTQAAAEAATLAAERYRDAADAHQIAAGYANRALQTGELRHIKAARDAFSIAAMADEDAASAAQISANHASHASSAFGMKGLTIV